MFLEKRVYQGSSAARLPEPLHRPGLRRARSTAPWQAVHLENEYVRLMILPEIGGRIHVGQDKTNGYDFFYRQHVIKPALVGLLGPWISRRRRVQLAAAPPPVDVHAGRLGRSRSEPDGSVTVWCSEHDPMHRMKGMHGVTGCARTRRSSRCASGCTTARRSSRRSCGGPTSRPVSTTATSRSSRPT